jgi:tetratricopeptide (TPR) repeat protein
MWKKRAMKIIFNLWQKLFQSAKNLPSISLILTFLAILNLPCLLEAQMAEAAQDKKEKEQLAQLYKQRGDQFVSRDNYKEAAQAYIMALSLARDSFSPEERTELATYISWGGKLKAAAEELKFVLAQQPANLKARLHLARILSWMGRYEEALREVNMILSLYPQNQEALLIKANLRRWRGEVEKAKSLYQRLLEKEENFEARLGLIYTYLYLGQRKQALNDFKLLKPRYAYEEKETERLAIALAREIDHSFDGQAFYYADEDENESYFYPLNFTFWLSNWRCNFNFQHREARDKRRQVKSEDFFLKTYFRPKEFLGVGAGAGFLQLRNGRVKDFLTWNLKADMITSATRAGFSLSRQGFTETAQLIRNEIRYINFNLYLSQKITDRFSFWSDFTRRDYSDNNYSRGFQLALIYRLHLYQPSFNLGYRTRYLNFKRQTYSGYFDPDVYLSHQIFTTFYTESLRFYLYFEPYAGYQSYRRYEKRITNWIGGASFSLGWIISRNFLLEIKAEGGNFSLATATGWRYYLLGFRLFISF